MGDEEMQCTQSQVRGGGKGMLLPVKSKGIYEKEYEKYVAWCSQNHEQIESESALMAYFDTMGKTKKSSTLWTMYSMLRTMLSIRQNVDISKFMNLAALLKRSSEGYEPKKSKILQPDDIDRFINDAPDEVYLAMKIVLIMGYCGACTREELTHMLIDDVEFKADIILVSVSKSQTSVSRLFTVTDQLWISIIKNYVNGRPSHTRHRRFFLTYHNGRCTTQPIGINRIGSIPRAIATYLKLPDPQLFSGHCFRRSSASHLTKRCGNILRIKHDKGWKHSAAGQIYTQASLKRKIQATQMPPTWSEASTSVVAGCSYPSTTIDSSRI